MDEDEDALGVSLPSHSFLSTLFFSLVMTDLTKIIYKQRIALAYVSLPHIPFLFLFSLGSSPHSLSLFYFEDGCSP